MVFCTKCGTQLEENAKFCSRCGEQIVNDSSVVRQSPNPQQAVQPQVYMPVQSSKDFSKITVRYRCPNGDVFDGNDAMTACPKCNAPLQKGGYIQLYRMGNYMGCAVGMGIYVNDVPFGHIANKQSIKISLPYGSYKLHVTHTTTRKCNDPVVTITPENSHVWYKARFKGMGFSILVEPSSPADMPEK